MTERKHIAEHRAHSRRDFERSLACSLLCVVLLFALFPVFSSDVRDVIPRSALIEPADILQAPPSTAHTGAPPPARKTVPIALRTDLPVLPDMPLAEEVPERDWGDLASARDREQSAAGFAAVPRQVLEVLPENGDGACEGSITLLLTVAWDGKPRDHRILKNTVHDAQCLRQVLEAVYASRWSALPTADSTRTFTVRKSWTFR